jgi:transposase
MAIWARAKNVQRDVGPVVGTTKRLDLTHFSTCTCGCYKSCTADLAGKIVQPLDPVSGVGQNQPVKVEIKGIKTSHFLEQKTAPRDCIEAGSMGHVERPQSDPSSNDLQFIRPGLVSAAHRSELGIDRETVGGYLLLAKPAISTAGKGAGRKSQCEPLAEAIMAKVEVGLSAQRIYQDLVAENAFTDSYQSVKRFVRKLRATHPERVWRMECQPGEEIQLDFGLGAPIDGGQGKSRRSWVLRLVLSYSRKGYSEAVIRQDTETFLRCLENGLRSFGGSPLLINLDNMKSAVLKADWFDPEINPKLADFCRHYGMHVMPCRPSMPQHKGKIERGVAYLRTNALKGRRFASLAEENLFLSYWENSIADKRIHGTTRKQVAACFEEERPHLQPLPQSLFPCYQEARRSVHRDSYVEVERAFYEAPPELIGREVWVRWDSRCVRIFNEPWSRWGCTLASKPASPAALWARAASAPRFCPRAVIG